MREGDRSRLIEAVIDAFRAQAPDGRVLPSPEWRDLDRAARVEAHEEARAQRALEAALDPDGLSTTARAVLARLERSE